MAAAQLIFIFNLIWSLKHGKPAGGNPWRATTLEWQTPDTPPRHGNWGPELPVVYRWAYEYGAPGNKEDFVPQNAPPDPRHHRRAGSRPQRVNPVVATVALLAGILVWWLFGAPADDQGRGRRRAPFDGRDAARDRQRPAPARVGLWVFLAVVTSFFALFITAYLMRMSPHLPGRRASCCATGGRSPSRRSSG